MAKEIRHVLAGGKRKPHEKYVRKQYLLLCGKPVLYYALEAFEDSPVDEIVLVTGEGERNYCKKEIVKNIDFRK